MTSLARFAIAIEKREKRNKNAKTKQGWGALTTPVSYRLYLASKSQHNILAGSSLASYRKGLNVFEHIKWRSKTIDWNH